MRSRGGRLLRGETRQLLRDITLALVGTYLRGLTFPRRAILSELTLADQGSETVSSIDVLALLPVVRTTALSCTIGGFIVVAGQRPPGLSSSDFAYENEVSLQSMRHHILCQRKPAWGFSSQTALRRSQGMLA